MASRTAIDGEDRVLRTEPRHLCAISGWHRWNLGCQMAGGDPAPCNCLGVDVGKPIYMKAMMGWFAIGTLPLGVIGVVAVLAMTTVQEIAERLRDRSARQRAELEDF